ncbi:MAG: hypothetical protein HOP18_05045 [Deltaproteobacteria bacterium]|nr:hypothetical protein [Deltaproteobacteria bacterium]
MDAHFVKRTIKKIIPPGAATSGFVYTNLDLGAKEVVVTLLGRGTFKDFFFFLSSGNLHTHYAEVDFASLHRPDDLVVCASEPELRAALEQLPCCTTNEDESALGDPLNLVLIGEAEELLAAFVDRHWDMTEKLHAGSVWREVTAFLTGARYRYAPFSPLYFSGRRQDLALQKARETIRARNHLRLWRTPIRFTGKPVWVGQVSRDIGVRVTTKTWNLLTHRIDPNVDDTRDYVVQSLILSQRVATVGYIRGGEATQEDAPRRNLTGDP